MTTLNHFIEERIKIYGISIKEKNKKKVFAKIRAKYTSILKNNEPFKSSQTWEKAPTILVERSKTKNFKTEDLLEADRQAYNYMINLAIKSSNLDPKEIKTEVINQEKALNDYYDKISNMSQEEYYNYSKNQEDDYGPENGEALKNSLRDLMIEALFNKFFTMTPEQKDLFAHDRGTLYWPGEESITSETVIIAKKRLKHPEKYYYSSK